MDPFFSRMGISVHCRNSQPMISGSWAVIRIAFPDDQIYWHLGLRHWFVGPGPLGGAVEVGGEQVGPCAQCQRHGLPAAGVAVDIDLV